MLIESEKTCHQPENPLNPTAASWIKKHKLRLVFPPLNFLCIYWISYSVVFRKFQVHLLPVTDFHFPS